MKKLLSFITVILIISCSSNELVRKTAIPEDSIPPAKVGVHGVVKEESVIHNKVSNERKESEEISPFSAGLTISVFHPDYYWRNIRLAGAGELTEWELNYRGFGLSLFQYGVWGNKKFSNDETDISLFYQTPEFKGVSAKLLYTYYSIRDGEKFRPGFTEELGLIVGANLSDNINLEFDYFYDFRRFNSYYADVTLEFISRSDCQLLDNIGLKLNASFSQGMWEEFPAQTTGAYLSIRKIFSYDLGDYEMRLEPEILFSHRQSGEKEDAGMIGLLSFGVSY